jgi:glutamine amidotransferase
MNEKAPKRVLVDYGLSNISAFKHKLDLNGLNFTVATSPEEINEASLLIVPGVGHFSSAMRYLIKEGLVSAIQEKVLAQKTPIVGVCLGMQLLTDFSEEGSSAGLSLISGKTVQLRKDGDSRKILSNVRWARLEQNTETAQPLSICTNGQFYFCHSYRVECESEAVVAYSYAMGERFPAIIRSGNIVGIQFHPEKSHHHGLSLLTDVIQELEKTDDD